MSKKVFFLSGAFVIQIAIEKQISLQNSKTSNNQISMPQRNRIHITFFSYNQHITE